MPSDNTKVPPPPVSLPTWIALVWLLNLIPGCGLGFLLVAGVKGLPLLFFVWVAEIAMSKVSIVWPVYFGLSLLGTLVVIGTKYKPSGRESTAPWAGPNGMLKDPDAPLPVQTLRDADDVRQDLLASDHLGHKSRSITADPDSTQTDQTNFALNSFQTKLKQAEELLASRKQANSSERKSNAAEEAAMFGPDQFAGEQSPPAAEGDDRSPFNESAFGSAAASDNQDPFKQSASASAVAGDNQDPFKESAFDSAAASDDQDPFKESSYDPATAASANQDPFKETAFDSAAANDAPDPFKESSYDPAVAAIANQDPSQKSAFDPAATGSGPSATANPAVSVAQTSPVTPASTAPAIEKIATSDLLDPEFYRQTDQVAQAAESQAFRVVESDSMGEAARAADRVTAAFTAENASASANFLDTSALSAVGNIIQSESDQTALVSGSVAANPAPDQLNLMPRSGLLSGASVELNRQPPVPVSLAQAGDLPGLGDHGMDSTLGALPLTDLGATAKPVGQIDQASNIAPSAVTFDAGFNSTDLGGYSYGNAAPSGATAAGGTPPAKPAVCPKCGADLQGQFSFCIKCLAML